jgi:hypothetical protein
LLPGQFPANKRDTGPDSCAGNANYLNCRAVIANTQSVNFVFTMTILRYTTIADLAHLLLRDTQPNAHAKAKEPNPFALFD